MKITFNTRVNNLLIVAEADVKPSIIPSFFFAEDIRIIGYLGTVGDFSAFMKDFKSEDLEKNTELFLQREAIIHFNANQRLYNSIAVPA